MDSRDREDSFLPTLPPVAWAGVAACKVRACAELRGLGVLVDFVHPPFAALPATSISFHMRDVLSLCRFCCRAEPKLALTGPTADIKATVGSPGSSLGADRVVEDGRGR